MKKLVLIAASLMFTTQIWASGLIECKFDSYFIYKMSVLLNPGNNGVTLELMDLDNPTFTYIEGRDGEEVKFNTIGDTEQFILQAHGSEGTFITAIFQPVVERRSTVELFLTKYGEVKRYEGRCFVVAGH